MVRTFYKVLVVDAVLLLAEYFVLKDLGWRSAYAASEGLSSSFSYSLLIQIFTINGRSFPLQSPPTFDWVQLIIAILVVLNGWYFVRFVVRKGKTATAALPQNKAQS